MPVRSLLIFLIACPLPAREGQAPGPEAVLKKLEDTFQTAKTVGLKFTCTETVGDDKAEGKGSLHMKEGNKIRILNSLRHKNMHVSMNVFSDGTTVALPMGNTLSPRPVTPSLRSATTKVLVRIGLFEGWFFLRRATALETPGEIEAALKNIVEISGLAFGDHDGSARTLTYKARDLTAGGGPLVSVKLWYDPKTYRIKKRTTERMGGKGLIRITEEYQDLIFNAEILDETFKLPGE